MALLNKALNIPIQQQDVDFIMPDLDVDRRLGIDPFLLYRSSNPEFQQAHNQLLDFFNFALGVIQEGDTPRAERLLQFPEPNEIGLGYTRRGISGSGIGPELAKDIVRTLRSSPALLSRGFRHIEELQLICTGVGPDRISDMTANILKLFLINYTQEQCRSWNIPLEKDVPVTHFFDFERYDWQDGYYDLPVNPSTGNALLLVPRRILRILPWINYDDYVGEYRRFFLKHGPRKRSLKLKAKIAEKKENEKEVTTKDQICQVTRQNVAALDTYIEKKEREAANAEPTELETLKDQIKLREHADSLWQELSSTNSGKEDAYKYQDLVHRILTFCFHPYLTDGKPQERTYSGTLIRDLVFNNEGTRNYWRYILQTHGNLLIVFELKNKEEVTGADIDQLATYLGDTMGRVGFLVSRAGSGKTSFNRRKAIYNKETPRKVVLHLTDEDLRELMNQRSMLKDTTDYIQQMYREFMVSIE